MTSGKGSIKKCLFCEHSARSDHIRDHIASIHPMSSLLDTRADDFEKIVEKPQILVFKRVSSRDLRGFCYGCNKIIESPGKSYSPFREHVCLAPRPRNRSAPSETPAPVQTAPRPPPPAPAAAPVKQRSVISFLKKYQKTFKNFNITEWEEKMREKFADFGDDSDEEEFDEFGDFLLPLVQELVTGYNKTSHQHDALEEYRIHKHQLESEIEELKEKNQELREIIEEQESDKITLED